MADDWEDYLASIYYDPRHPASFAGPKKLHRVVQKEGKHNISLYKIKKWLQSQETYSMQRGVRRNFTRNRVIVTGIDDQWDADLMDMTRYAKYNDNIHFILVVIDVFSKYVWLQPLQNKRGPSVAEAFRNIFQQGRRPSRIRTDKGQEFLANATQKVFEKEDIHHFVSQNEVKANVAERAIKTLKSKILRYITYKQNYRYIDHLQDFADSYNDTYHSSIGMAPAKVTKKDELAVWWKLYWPKKTTPKSKKMLPITKKPKRTMPKPFKFKVGDYVRITHLRHVFTREYDQKWTGEIFKISERFLRQGLPIYKIKDFNGHDIKGSFYQAELQKVTLKEDQLWKIDKILKTRKRKGNTEYLVRWLYWPKSFDSWINAKDVVDL